MDFIILTSIVPLEYPKNPGIFFNKVDVTFARDSFLLIAADLVSKFPAAHTTIRTTFTKRIRQLVKWEFIVQQ